MIFTTYYNHKSYSKMVQEGKPLYAISRSFPKWLEIPKENHLKILAPSQTLFKKSFEMPMEEFSVEYTKELEIKKELIEPIIRELNEKNAILTCYCKNYNECHRSVLAEYIKNNFGIKVDELSKKTSTVQPEELLI